ncbi:MAG TPA: hypothetical protein VMA72_00780 [Streptosporangiaceae bacterium]|nr:hypothetical protein [Streptosporangiaceae bacterium]
MRAADLFRRVLVGFEGSADAAEALLVAAAVADAAGDPAQLVILCVTSLALRPEGESEGSDGARLRAQAEALLMELALSARPEFWSRRGWRSCTPVVTAQATS